MDDNDCVVPPVIAKSKNGWRRSTEDREIAPPDLGHLLAHANEPLHPVQQRVRVSPLFGNTDVLISIRAAPDHGGNRPVAASESSMRIYGPLHWGARALALRQPEIVTHSDFVSVADHRRPGQCHHQAVCEFNPAAIA